MMTARLKRQMSGLCQNSKAGDRSSAYEGIEGLDSQNLTHQLSLPIEVMVQVDKGKA